MSKLISALLSDKYVKSAEILEDSKLSNMEKYVVAPRMFKQLVARGHAEFSSGRQQDASEYFQHVLNCMQRAERTSIDRITAGEEGGTKRSTTAIFEFYPESRYQDIASGCFFTIIGEIYTSTLAFSQGIDIYTPIQEKSSTLVVKMHRMFKTPLNFVSLWIGL